MISTSAGSQFTGPDLAGLLALPDLLTGAGRGLSRSSNMETVTIFNFLILVDVLVVDVLTSSHLFTGDIPSHFFLGLHQALHPGLPSSLPGRHWSESQIFHLGVPVCPSVDAAAGAEEVEVTRMLVGSILKPGGGAEKFGRGTHLSPCRQEQRQEALPRRLERRSWALASHPKQNTGKRNDGWRWDYGHNCRCHHGMHYGCRWCMSCRGISHESRKAVRLSFGSRGRGGTILMQVLGTFSRACCLTEAKP